jgi:PTH2 family peptidyl-tRNA hydrolase
MYIFANAGLGMSPGKLAAQCGHAAVEAYRLSIDRDIHERHATEQSMTKAWLDSGHTKLVMEARDTEHLISIHMYLTQKGYNTSLIIDEGRTEVSPHTPTALGVQIVDKDSERVQFAFSDFKTLKPPKKLRYPFRKASLWDLLKGRAVVIEGELQ